MKNGSSILPLIMAGKKMDIIMADKVERERTTWIVTNAKGLNERFKKQQPAIVDIMPSLASFLNIRYSQGKANGNRWDSTNGKLSATNATADLMNDAIEVKWNVINKEGRQKYGWQLPTILKQAARIIYN